MVQDALPIVIVAGESVDTATLEKLTAGQFQIQKVGWNLDAAKSESVAVVVVDGSLDPAEALLFCRSMRTYMGHERPPIVFLAADAATIRLQALEHGADACLVRPFSPEELRGQITALLPWRATLARMRSRAEELHLLHDRLQKAFAQINTDLDLARRLQASFLPKQLPEVGHARLAVWSRSHGLVGGDFYDAFRLDERHVGFYLADAMGHGVPAGLLAIFLKRAVTPKDISASGYHLVPPDEVLARLNRDLIEQNLPEQPFVTMVYGLLNCFSGELTMARAGHPYPLLMPAKGHPQVWQIPGTLIGVFEAKFISERKILQFGDRLLLVTDGVAASMTPHETHDHEEVLRAANQHRDLPLQPWLERCAAELSGTDPPADDQTMLAVEMGG
jgi:serine phosphatase RsbU (regulator of sigma subunit)